METKCDERRIDPSWRNKDVSVTIPLHSFPADEERFSEILEILDIVGRRKDLFATIRLDGSEDYREISVTHTGCAYYMEIVYRMEACGWTHPLHLASDHLNQDEAEEALRSVLVNEDDQIPLILYRFHNITDTLYPEDAKDSDKAAADTAKPRMFFYGRDEYENNPEKYEADCQRAIEMLRSKGFNEKVLEEEIEYSKRDYGEEFFWTVLHSSDLLEEWAEKYDLSDKTQAETFVMRCTWDGD